MIKDNSLIKNISFITIMGILIFSCLSTTNASECNLEKHLFTDTNNYDLSNVGSFNIMAEYNDFIENNDFNKINLIFSEFLNFSLDNFNKNTLNENSYSSNDDHNFPSNFIKAFAIIGTSENGSGEYKTNNTVDNDNTADNNSSKNDSDSSGKAGMIITVTSDKTNYKAGDIVTFYVTIQNVGDVDLSNVNIAALLPKGLEFISTYTGTTKNKYNSESGVWQVDNLKKTASGAGLGPGVKRLIITARVTPEMAGKDFNLQAYILSAIGANGQDISGSSSSSIFFSVSKLSGDDGVDGTTDGGGNGSSNNTQKNNSDNDGIDSKNPKNNPQKGANHTNKGTDVSELANILDNQTAGRGLLNKISKVAATQSYANDSNASTIGTDNVEALDGSNPSSTEPVYEVKNASKSGSDSGSSKGSGYMAIGLALIGIILIGYFYGIKK